VPADAAPAASLDRGRAYSGVDHARALQVMRVARSGEADRALDAVDVLVVLTMLDVPPTLDELSHGTYSIRRTPLTSLLNFTGQPVVTMACGLTDDGLPVGISFIGRGFEEAVALRAARTFERIRGDLPWPPATAGL